MCFLDLFKLYFITVIFVLFAFDSSESWNSGSLMCFQKGPCNCTTEDGAIIDLSPLSKKLEPLIASSQSYLYMFSPCTDRQLKANITNDCNKGYGLCYFAPNEKNSKPITLADVVENKIAGNITRFAINDEGVFSQNEVEGLEIIYKNMNNETVITSVIRLHCDESVHNYIFSVQKSEKLLHVMTLTSKYACRQFLEHHMSGAAVFFLILLVVIALYFIGGILVLKFIRGAKGLEMIPNHEFWCGLPGAAQETFAYLKSFCYRDRRGRSGTYESI